MSGKIIHPRPAQVAELTRNHVLPLEAIPDFHMEIIADCLAQEWNELVRIYGASALTDEVEANTLMCSRLNNLEHPLWRDLVAGVGPGQGISYDGSHLEKRPDISLHLTRRPSAFRLDVECKLIDHPSGKTIGLYANKGLARFLNGEYAWATREALMVGYVRDGSAIEARLTQFLARHKQNDPDPYNTDQLPAGVGDRVDLARSTHARTFVYPLQSPSSPGPIVIWHLWL
jgi:hypothetical protein